jgi:uncharacterized protein YbaR (Trm112 family)
MIERQELHCHICDKYVQFDIDISLNGNYVLACPNCKHEHYRLVVDGKITDVRWDQINTNLQFYAVNTYAITTSSTSTYNTYAINSSANTANSCLYASWMNTTTSATS